MNADPLPSSLAFADSSEVREYLVKALKLDLVGPNAEHDLADERLPGWVRPSNWYLTGFLIPSDTPFEERSDDDEDESLDETPEVAGLAEESAEERRAAKRGYFPSSMGLSFLVSRETEGLDVTVRWGDYKPGEGKGADGKPLAVWERTAHERTLAVALAGRPDYAVPESRGLRLHVVSRVVDVGRLAGLPEGVRSVSVFLVNNRSPVPGRPDDSNSSRLVDRAYAFQAELEIRSGLPFVPRPDPRGARAAEWDDEVADLHYSDTPEYAVGHGVSAEWETAGGECRRLRTAWIPSATVAKTEPVERPEAELSMEVLGKLPDGAATRTALQPLVEGYRAWIELQRGRLSALTGDRRETAEELLRRAGLAAERIERGIDLLASDADALDAFRMANRAVARALQQRLGPDEPPPTWRTFQIAFILLNLPGLADPHDPQRRIVDLLFFPTGGGKTEAYLGLAAFAIVLRRLRRPGEGGRHGAGVAVIMRYTLRLLTLDQLARASGLVCALELEREDDPDRYGVWPFEIGLWVGKAATPNVIGRKGDSRSDSARSKTRQFKANPTGKPLPIPLESCPWCGSRFEPASFTLLPDDDRPTELRIVCADFECDFSGDRPLPILAVDEPLYRRLPAFLIATVDKFASLPWTAQTGALLGGADRYDDDGFYGPADPRRGRPLGRRLAGPDLVIQDELHLISGPLGTMAGLYEAVIEALSVRADGEADDLSRGSVAPAARPKIVASTATARQAQDQIQALFARPSTQVFPPPGPDRRDSFFAEVMPTDRASGRLYLGIASPGRNPKKLMQRVWLALMGAAERAYRDSGGHRNEDNPADPYMTVLGYFNSLRELGGARRILEEEVRNTVKAYGQRRRIGQLHSEGLFRDRRTFSDVVELTSRVPTGKVAEARRRLGCGAHENDRVDSAIATNMISVGLDIPRLGLMVVLGQPKTHSEYIQATSRVGRDDRKPGLVVTLLNVHKPRDRSHFERFRHYHETFYRSVEVSSVTPFSARALDRGFAGALVGLARHSEPSLTPPSGVAALDRVRVDLERRLREVFLERVDEQPYEDETEHVERRHSVAARVVDLLDSWLAVVADYSDVNTAVKYQKYEGKAGGGHLLREMLEEDFESAHHAKFRANRSLRDVEPEVNLRIRPLTASLSDGDE
ncbi:MAG: DISARM system helicase DrmA [bacterium]|nr:DISARM system helicase DrmA [bacterium]